MLHKSYFIINFAYAFFAKTRSRINIYFSLTLFSLFAHILVSQIRNKTNAILSHHTSTFAKVHTPEHRDALPVRLQND